MILNPWRPYPLWIPKKEGYYRCTIMNIDGIRKVIDLYFDSSDKLWIDKKRQQLFKGYKVYKSGRAALEYNRVHEDRLCKYNNVVAWRKIEKPCWMFNKKGE